MSKKMKHLDKPAFAADYLSVAMEQPKKKRQQDLMMRLREVAIENGGLSSLADGIQIDTANSYKLLSKDSNPTLRTLILILDYFDLQLAFRAKNK